MKNMETFIGKGEKLIALLVNQNINTHTREKKYKLWHHACVPEKFQRAFIVAIRLQLMHPPSHSSLMQYHNSVFSRKAVHFCLKLHGFTGKNKSMDDRSLLFTSTCSSTRQSPFDWWLFSVYVASFWNDHAKPATFAREKDQTTTPGTS